MPTIFDISLAAFAIATATNPTMPPPKPQNAQVIVEPVHAEEIDASLSGPAPKPATNVAEARADCAAIRTGETPACVAAASQ